MPRWVAEAKKREEEKKAGAKKPQSSSVKNVNKKAQNSTFMGGGTSVKKAEKTYKAAKRPSAKARQVAEEQKRRRELEQHQNQKTYGDQKRATPRRTTTTSNNLTQHTTAAQRQKMGMPTAEDLRQGREHRRALANSVKDSVRRATSEENKSFMQRQKSGIQTEADRQYSEKLNQRRAEVAKNTGRAATKGVQDTLTGYGKTLADVDEMAKSNKNWTKAKASKMGISEDDTVGMAKVEGERQKSVKQAQELRRDLAEKQDKRQAEWDERTKNAKGLEKAWYGAVESGTGMATDALVGGLTGTGTAGSLASMAVRTYGTTRGQAEKEGATENEDRAYALLQAAKEVGTELMFPGAGLAKKTYGKVGLSVADRVANKLTKGLTGNKADLVGAGVRLLGGTAEENAEELAGWGLDPVIKELAYGKNVRTREAQKLLKQESDELRSNLKSADDARSVAAYLGSDRFLADNIAQYKDAGLSDKQAREVAEKMRDYLTASLTGDTGRMGDLEDEIVTTVAGGSLKAMMKDLDVGELIDTFASTSVLTLATGLPATATTAMKGAKIRENLGSEGLRALSQTAINFEDDEASLKGQAARDRLDSGKDLTSTQVFDLARAQAEQIQKDEKRVAAMSDMADSAIRSEKLVTPKIGFRENGSVAGDEIITMNYVNESNNATEIISDLLKEEGSESLTDTEVQTGSRAIAGFKTGAFTVNDANALNYTNTTVRTAFEAATGVNLSQYVVRRNGQVDIPATNAATKDALFAMAADNFVKTAQAETANWMDSVKGDVVTQVTERMGAQGSLALQQALDDVDERDRSTYMMNANAADMMYQTARNMGTEWDSVKAEARKMFPGISETKLEAMYNAGLRDKADAANGAIGQQVRMGEAMALQNEPSEPKGKVFVDTSATPKGTVVRTFSEIASNLGVDIHLVDDLKTSTGNQANGQYVNGAIYINMNSDFESNIGYIFMHEVTHHLKQYAPEQFNELENLVREKWFGYNPEQMQNEIAKKIELYKKNGQTLSEEEALEEIIADAAHEFINDRNFADQVAEQNPDIAKAILNGIRNALRMLRRIFAAGSIDDETHMNSLFSQLNILDEAEKLWLNAYTQAVQNKAAVAIDEWQDRANKASISESANTYYNEDTPIEDLDQHNATVEDDNGDMVAEFQDNGSVRFSISSFDDKGRAIYKKYLNKMVKTGEMSQQEADDMMNELETVYKICKDFADKVDDKGNPVFAPYTSWSYADVVTDEKGKPVFSAIKKNSEYKMNIDFSTICKKRRTLDAVFREMINRGLMEQLDFNKDESAAMVVNINNLIRQNDFEAACALCFVEARRYRQQQTATTFRDMWNDLVESMYKDKSKIAYFNFGQDSTVEDVPDGIHTMDAKDLDLTHIKEIANARKEDGKLMQTAEAKAARLILKDPSQRKLMRIGDMMASTGFENMQIQNPKLMKIYNAKKGTGGAKSSFGDVQYLNEIINSKTFDRRKAYAVSGVRIQSFSDYVPRMVFDYVQVIADLAAKKLPAHAYTKEVLFAQQFGLTGAKINLSLVPDVVADGVAPGLDAQGNYIWNEEGTFPFDEAMKLQEAKGYKENCGTIAVGISDEQIIKMLADPKIQMVIPYHKSSLNPIVAAMTNVDRFENYEKFQTTKDENGNALSKDFDWDNKLFELSHDKDGNQLPKEQWGNVQDLVKEYADWCKEHNYTPKFPQFLYMEDGSINPGYYKLLEDFALLDNKGNFKPQGDVQMRFPTEADEFGSMQSLIEQGLTEDTELEANRTAKIGGIVDRIKEMMDEGTLAEQSTTSEKLAAKFSISETDADGKVLTDGQMEYFKNSQARDEQGRLVPVFHTTNKGGFTIFDPMRSDDFRCLFFSSDWDVSQTYGTYANSRFYQYDINNMDDIMKYLDAYSPDRFVVTREEFNKAGGYNAELVDFENASHKREDRYDIEKYVEAYNNGTIDKDDYIFIVGVPDYSPDTNSYADTWVYGTSPSELVKEVHDHFLSQQESNTGDSTVGAQHGYYACYLNLENPLVIDAHGANWTEVPYTTGSENPIRQQAFDAMRRDSKYEITEIRIAWKSGYENATLMINTMNGPITQDFNDGLGFGGTLDAIGSYWTDGLGMSPEYLSYVINHMGGAYHYIPENKEESPIDYIGTNGNRLDYEEYFDKFNVDDEYDYYDYSREGSFKTREIAEIAQNEGHDGVIIRNLIDIGDASEFEGSFLDSDIYIAFSSDQVKDINNENPTENPDIRYSIPDEDEVMNYAQTYANSTDDVWATDPAIAEGRVRYSVSKRDFINGVTNKWNPAWRTNGEILDEKSVEKEIRDLIKGAMRGSNTKAKYRQEMVKETMLVARKAYNLMKKDKPSQAANLLYDHAHKIIDNLEFFGTEDQSAFERYKDLRDYLKTTKITVPYDRRRDIDYSAYRKRNFGKILLGNDGIAPDVAWQELNEMWPEVFTEDIKGDIPGIMLQIENALDICQPMAQAYTSEQCEEFAGDIADALYDILYEGKEYKSLADKYEDKAKAMKARHAEAMTKMQEKLGQKDSKYEELKKRYQYDTAYLKAQKEKAVKEAKEQSKQKEKEKRERQNHRALYNKVLKEYNDLTHKLLHPTKEKAKNIPEQLRQPLAQMLHCFDLEKERSKELEEMYRIPTRSQLNFRELKDAFEKVIKEDPTAYELSDVHKYMADKMVELADRVDGKTIDYLDSADIQTIYDLLKGISAGIRNGQQLEIDGENYQKQQMCDKVGEGAAEHQKLYGKAKKYGNNDRPGIRAYADHIINMGELTPIYFFRQIKGMYDMYRQMRKGFDTYVRNEKDIINKIGDILSDYYKKNRKGERVQGSEIEEWRHAESAETFDLMYGTITLTTAQKMSLYCLAKRSQAQGHMYSEKGGIVASEITAGSKIHQAEERYKGKTIEYKPVVITPADIDQIVSTLTEDQIRIANQLQDLMSVDMAKLGNQASVKLTGIEMYKDDNYFPIKVMGESLPTNPENIGIREKIRNPGFSNPLVEEASNPIIVDDIFTVVASHCNEMNQYASYAVPITNFMKVYNGSVINEEGKAVKIKTVLKETYGEKALTYIENFIDDINGNSFKRHGGIDDVLDKALGQAKKAAVFANLRVALQQPTAIIRALAVMNPKYFIGVHPSIKATEEMIEHCPIAQWKALGYFDTHFGRDIEDVMMGRDVSSKANQLMSEIYGQLDNMTWGMIWQAVKNEVRAQNKGIDETSQEFWDLCNERASFVFDSTQVVDSPFHRSNDMRSKDRFVKQLTSFQAEPTLSFNVLRQGFVDAYEALKKGDSKTARRILERVIGVWVAQALTVALAQSIVDALRRKGHKKEDDEEDEMLTWYQEFVKYFFRNFGNNFKDDLNPINNIYFVKDIVPPIMNAIKGEYVYGTQSLTTQWVDTLTNGISMCKKKWEKGDADSHTWYDCLTELFGGLGYLKGIPAKTMMRGTKNAFHWAGKIFGINVFADDGKAVDKAVDSFVDKFRGDESEGEGGGLFDSIANKMGYRKSDGSSGDTEESKAGSADIDAKLEEYEESLSDTYTDKQKKNLVKQYKKTLEKEAVTEAAMSEDFDVQAHIAEAQADFDYEMEKRSIKAAEMAAGKTGRQRDEALWDVIADGYTKSVESGNMATIQRMREEFAKQGGDTEWFDAKIADKMKSAYKKTIYSSDEIVPGASLRQETMYNFMTEHGVSEKEISDIVYHSYTARDLKAAMRIGNEDYILDELVPLVAAGLSREDYEKLYKYRNMGAKTYDGKYTDPKYTKTTGTFVWPTEGVITSHFGYRNSPTAGASSNHPAIDIGAPMGTTVVAADGGTVIYAGSNGGYGNSVGVKHANGMVTYYNHLSAWNVKVGDQVAQGQPIANVGSTGISTGPHLDFKILDADGNPVDPEKYLNKRS